MLQRLKTIFACLGVLVTIVCIVPPPWYAQWLAGPWTDARAPVLIVLSGDSVRDGMMGVSSYWRSVYAVDVWNWGGIQHIILSGDSGTTIPMRTWMIGQGVPADAVTIEGRSQTTRENALFTAAFVRNVPGPYALLSSDIHMWRALRAFRKAGVNVIPRPAPDAFKRGTDWRDRWRVLLDVATECGKIVYYKSRDWI